MDGYSDTMSAKLFGASAGYNNLESVFIHEFAHLIMKSGIQDMNERSKKFMVKPLVKKNMVQSMDTSILSYPLEKMNSVQLMNGYIIN